MVETLKVEPLGKAVMEEIGMTWHTDPDGSSYISNDLVQITEDAAEAYYDAANSLYDMFIDAAERVIDEQLYLELGIPSNLTGLIEDSWEKKDLHLYGRFDLAGGLDGLPIKLLEFNADTPTGLFETSIIQWALLKSNGMDETSQFNNLHEMLLENFQRLITRDKPLEEFKERYGGEKLLFSSVGGLPEDEGTVRYLQRVAHDAGLYTDFCYMHELGFNDDEGVFNRDRQLADFWFKLFPWEDIAADELELTRMLGKMTRIGRTRMLNPAYTLLFQSKGLLKVLYDMFPESPYLLRTDFEPLPGVEQVSKKFFGREGANTTLFAANGEVLSSTNGPYEHQKAIYQERAQLPQDASGRIYQAGVFHVWEACGLGFRRGGIILDDTSKFVGHIVV